MQEKIVYRIYAGVNGAGKSTLYDSEHMDAGMKRVNADEILMESGGDWRNVKDIMTASKEAIHRVNRYLTEGISFCQETTLSGRSIFNNIKKAKERGFSIMLLYVGVDSPELAIERVKARVRNGGHGVSEEDIRRRYYRSLDNLKAVLPYCDCIKIYDNSGESLVNIVSINEVKSIFNEIPDWAKEITEEIKGLADKKKQKIQKKRGVSR
ncbi:MAG: AAA family ATPase [Lachnospiraceae bacterium]|nr:AAA family ATPase [Lachnospiraceae bacterium]